MEYQGNLEITGVVFLQACWYVQCVELTNCERISSVCVLSSCLSNAIHGQNINLLVSVCVCVRHFSVNSPTGQTPQRIFTVDSLKDADLCKDVPFMGLDDE